MAPNDKKGARLADSIRQIYSQATSTTDEKATRRRELEALARVQLGENYDWRKIDAVARFQGEWLEKQQALTETLDRGEIGPDAYRQKLREAISEMAFKCEGVLGNRDFERLFGVSPKDAPDILAQPIP
jgi:hypothetical protein